MPINYYCGITMNGSNIQMNKNQLLQPVIETGTTIPAVGTSVEGQMFFDTTTGDKTMYFFNGTAWVPMDGTGSGVASIAIIAAGTNSNGIDTSLVIDASTSANTLRPMQFGGSANIGMVPSAAGGTDSTKFLKGDGTWATPAGAYTGWTATGDSGTASVDSGGTVLFDGGSSQGITTLVNNSGTGGTVSFTLDITNLAVAVPIASDFFAFSDESATGDPTKKALISALPFDNFTSWTLAGSTGTNQTINSGNTATFQGYATSDPLAGISTLGSATDSLKIALDPKQIERLIVLDDPDTDEIVYFDANSEKNQRIPVSDIHLNQWGDAENTIDMGGFKILDVGAPTLPDDAATKAYVDGLVEGGLTFKGTFNALTGAIVSGGNSGSFLYQLTGTAFDPSAARVALVVGDYYVVATAGNFYGSSGTGTCSPTTQSLDIGDSVIAVLAAAVNTSNCADWSIIQSDEGVTDIDATFGTFITGNDKTNAVGSVDLGAIDLVNGGVGTPSSSTFYAGDGNWRTPVDTNLVTSVAASTNENLDGMSVTPTTGNVIVGLDVISLATQTTTAVDEDFIIIRTDDAGNAKIRVDNFLASHSYRQTLSAFTTGNTVALNAVVHGLGSFDVTVQLYDENTKETIQACVVRDTVNIVKITGNSYPSGNITVLVSKIG